MKPSAAAAPPQPEPEVRVVFRSVAPAGHLADGDELQGFYGGQQSDFIPLIFFQQLLGVILEHYLACLDHVTSVRRL